MSNLEIVTVSSVAFIAAMFFWAVVYVFIQSSEQLYKKRGWIEQLPSIISTLGVIGTFLGITLGLLDFDAENLDRSIPSLLEGLKTAFLTSLTGMVGSLILSRQISYKYGKQKDNFNDINTALHEIAKEVRALKDENINIKTTLQAESKNITGEIHNVKIYIGDNMSSTNDLLANKFDEFSILLRQSNTQALVDVMKNVTEEFQKQMNDIINKLVQKNFEELNKSVENLNKWQAENKESIEDLTLKYKQMVIQFEETSNVLSCVKEDVTKLVSEGGKLQQLIEALSSVMIEDRKFVEISNKLSNTAELTEKNIIQFEEASRKLNDWVRKQKDFVEHVVILIDKLNEINKIRDYNDEFWKSTKKHLEEGLGIIKAASLSLDKQIGDVNKEFYNRLNTTLTCLDDCIQAVIKKNVQK